MKKKISDFLLSATAVLIVLATLALAGLARWEYDKWFVRKAIEDDRRARGGK